MIKISSKTQEKNYLIHKINEHKLKILKSNGVSVFPIENIVGLCIDIGTIKHKNPKEFIRAVTEEAESRAQREIADIDEQSK